MNRPFLSTFPTVSAFPDTDVSAGERNALAGYLGRASAVLLAGFLVLITFDGALRYYLVGAGAPWAIYVKDVLLVVLTALGIVRLAVTDLRSPAFVAVASFFAVGTVAGLVLVGEVRQTAFAVKAILPLLCGTVMAPVVRQHARFFRNVCGFLLCSVIGGIVLTYVWRAPWVGFVYEVGGTTVAASREWAIGDAERVAGFSRASFDAALQCLCFAGFVTAFSRRYVVGAAIWLLTAGAVYLTLSRSAMVAVGVAAVLHGLVFGTRVMQRAAKIAVLASGVAVVALPFAAQAHYKNIAGQAETRSVTSTSSFEDRAINTWPDAFALVSERGNWLVGRGLGGIGVGQQHYEPDIYNPGDNFFVYLWGALGALGALFLAFIGWRVWNAPVPLGRAPRAGVLLTGTLLTVGLTLNMIEAAAASLFLGLALVWLRERASAMEPLED